MFIFNINLYSSTMEIIKKIIKRFKKWNAYWANIEKIRMECMIKSGKGFFMLCLLLASCRTNDVPKKECCKAEVKVMGVEIIEKSSHEKLYEKYEYLNDDPNILHWEIIDDSLHTYTKQDSIRDERERWRYIDSLYKADEAEELFYNYPGDTTYIQLMSKEYDRY